MSRRILFLFLSLLIASCQSENVGWIQIKPKTLPPKIALGSIAYHASSEQTVLFGGIITDKWSDETWIWNGDDWSKANPKNHPLAREKHVMVYDESRNRTVLFGGAMSNDIFDDTWEWDGNDWRLIQPAHKPSARCCHAMAYDSVNRKVLLYGGYDHTKNVFYSDTWTWDGVDWVEVDCCNAPLMSGHNMVSFSAQKRILSLQTNSLGTIIWNGSKWEEFQNIQSPSDRSTGRLAYDSKRNKVVLFGGIRDSQIKSDTWVFDGTKWIEVKFSVSPDARFGSMMFYDIKRQSIILYGGAGEGGALGDMWELRLPNDLSRFSVTPVAPIVPPPLPPTKSVP